MTSLNYLKPVYYFLSVIFKLNCSKTKKNTEEPKKYKLVCYQLISGFLKWELRSFCKD